MKIYILITLFGLSFWSNSCTQENDCCAGIPGNDDIFEFSIVNSKKEDLLNPETESTLNTSNIKVFEYKNEEYVEINNPNLDASKGYMIYETEGEFRMRLFLEAGAVVNDIVERKAILKWNESDQDTLELRLVQEPSNIQRLTRIIFNDNEVWNEENSIDNIRYFQIEK